MTNRTSLDWIFFRKIYPNHFSIFVEIHRLHPIATHMKVITFLGRHLERSRRARKLALRLDFERNKIAIVKTPRSRNTFPRLGRLNANKSLFVMLEDCILLDILHVCVCENILCIIRFHIEYLIISMRINNNNISYKDFFSIFSISNIF